jgi:glyoxylase-like metal-dependent hydrolase (beta-lactamase superfamily II)
VYDEEASAVNPEIDVASPKRSHPENVAGDFFVDTSCIDCDLCRQIAPQSFADVGDHSAVLHQPGSAAEVRAALQALVTCPTGSIGTRSRHDLRPVLDSYPEPIDGDVFFCGFAAESSFGAASWLVVHPDGNVLVDSPRFATQLVRRIEARGGVRRLFLTHRDDVADHERWARYFGAERILHERDVTAGTAGVEQRLQGDVPVALAPGLLAIPTPGHTAGHCVLLHRERHLFTGDHLWWSTRLGALHASRSVCWHSWSEQRRSVERLLDHRFEWVLPGHGRRLHAPVEEMRRQLRACLERMGRSG